MGPLRLPAPRKPRSRLSDRAGAERIYALSLELRQAEAELRERTQAVEAIGRLQTIPGVGALTATTIYAWVGDVRRFPDAKALGAYAGLVPSVRQSGAVQRLP